MTELSNARGDQRSRKMGAMGWSALRPVVIFGLEAVVKRENAPPRIGVEVKARMPPISNLW
jgi:hypothetical protein